MKKILVTVLIGLSLIILSNCSDDDKTTTSSSSSQFVLTEINEIQWYRDKQEYQDIYFWGGVFSMPVPNFNYFKLNGTKFSSPNNYSIGTGYSSFGLTWEDIENFYFGDQVSFEISTSSGSVSGSINRFDPIYNVRVNGVLVDTESWPEAQVDLNQELVLSWSYGANRPDFIRIYGWYEYYDAIDDEYVETRISKYLSSNSNYVTLFEENELSHEDSYLWFYLQPANGPNPETATKGNLQGSGTGCIYWKIDKREYDIDVQVGDSYYKSNDLENPEIKKAIKEEMKAYFRNDVTRRLNSN